MFLAMMLPTQGISTVVGWFGFDPTGKTKVSVAKRQAPNSSGACLFAVPLRQDSLIHKILNKVLYATLHDSRVLPGRHRSPEGVDHISDVITIDQSSIGRTLRSHPTTYIGAFSVIRRLFAQTPDAQARDYTASRFSFNVQEGRCAECTDEGVLRNHLQFMVDIEAVCPGRKGACFSADTLEVKYHRVT